MRRAATIGSPKSSTFSYAITAPDLADQCGSEYDRLSRCSARGSTHSGSMRPRSRPQSRDVSTSSPAITQRGGLLNSAEPGQAANRPPRAPAYSRFSGSHMPMCESSPASSETWTGFGSSPGWPWSPRTSMPSPRTT